MKFKLDENFGNRTQELFRLASHDAQSVLDEKLQGCSDQHLYKICCKEERCLVTLDLDFADITRFPPHVGNRCYQVINKPQYQFVETINKSVFKNSGENSNRKEIMDCRDG